MALFPPGRLTPIDLVDRTYRGSLAGPAVEAEAMVPLVSRSPRAEPPPTAFVDLLRWDANLEPLADWQVALGVVTFGKGTPYGMPSWEGLGLPDQRTNDVGFPSQHGVVALGDFHEGRPLVFTVCISEATPAAAWGRLRDLAGAWQAAVVSQPLRLGIPGVATFAVMGRPRRMEVDNSRLHRGQADVALEFLATDPRLYSIDVRGTSLTLAVVAADSGLCLADPGQCFDLSGCSLDLRGSSFSGAGVADNGGNTATPFVAVFTGPAVDPALLNLTTGAIVDFEGTTLAVGEVLEVDAHARRVVLNGQPRYDLLAPGSTFWKLLPGRNDLRYVALAAEGSVSVRWRDAWL
jgi:hypothetical protein